MEVDNMQNKEKIIGIDLCIIFSILGIIASIAVIFMNYLDGESIVIGILLFGSCLGNLLMNLRKKKNEK